MLLTPILLTTLLGAVDAPAPSATPSPAATPLREIGSVRANAACDSLVKLMVPVAIIAGNNDREFVALRTPIGKFRSGKGTGNGATIHNALATSSQPSSSTNGALSKADGSPQSKAAASRDPLAFDQNDDSNTYTPDRTLAAANIDRMTAKILHNLDEADKAMAQSWKDHPEHEDPVLNAMRQRVQNIIDLQRVLANRLDDAAGLYFSNAGGSSLSPDAERSNFKSLLDEMIDAGIQADHQAEVNLTATDSAASVGDVRALKSAPAGYVATALRMQEIALLKEAPNIARTCAQHDGTGAPAAPTTPNTATPVATP
jgi:hypothetical protein